MLCVELTEVENLRLGHFLLHLVDFVSAHSVQVESGQLLLQLLRVREVVQVLGGAAHEVSHERLVAIVVEALVIVHVRVVDRIITLVPFLIREIRALHVLIAHFVLIY